MKRTGKKPWYKISVLFLSLLFLITGCVGADVGEAQRESGQIWSGEETEAVFTPDEDAGYSSPEQVAAYIHAYGHLPPNYITKKEAKAEGWDNAAGNLWEVTDQKSIGGDVFGNYEGLLPEKDGRIWYECDVNYKGGYRGAERILYSSDGLIYYTKDHYESYERLY